MARNSKRLLIALAKTSGLKAIVTEWIEIQIGNDTKKNGGNYPATEPSKDRNPTCEYLDTQIYGHGKNQLKGPISRVPHARSILEASPDFRRRAGHLPLAGPPLVTRGRAGPPVSQTSQPPKSAHTSLRKVARVFFVFSFCFCRSLIPSKWHSVTA